MKPSFIPPANILTPAKLQLLIETARTRKTANAELYLRLLSQAGLRLPDIESLTPAMFDVSKGTLHLTGKEVRRSVPLSDPFRKAMFLASTSPDFLQFASQDWTRTLGEIATESEIDFCANTLRKSYVVYFIARFGDIDKSSHGTDHVPHWERRFCQSVATQFDAHAWFSV